MCCWWGERKAIQLSSWQLICADNSATRKSRGWESCLFPTKSCMFCWWQHSFFNNCKYKRANFSTWSLLQPIQQRSDYVCFNPFWTIFGTLFFKYDSRVIDFPWCIFFAWTFLSSRRDKSVCFYVSTTFYSESFCQLFESQSLFGYKINSLWHPCNTCI